MSKKFSIKESFWFTHVHFFLCFAWILIACVLHILEQHNNINRKRVSKIPGAIDYTKHNFCKVQKNPFLPPPDKWLLEVHFTLPSISWAPDSIILPKCGHAMRLHETVRMQTNLLMNAISNIRQNEKPHCCWNMAAIKSQVLLNPRYKIDPLAFALKEFYLIFSNSFWLLFWHHLWQKEVHSASKWPKTFSWKSKLLYITANKHSELALSNRKQWKTF